MLSPRVRRRAFWAHSAPPGLDGPAHVLVEPGQLADRRGTRRGAAPQLPAQSGAPVCVRTARTARPLGLRWLPAPVASGGAAGRGLWRHRRVAPVLHARAPLGD